MFVANVSTCPSALTGAASEDVHSEKTCLHSDGFPPSTVHKSDKLSAHEPAATRRGPNDTLQKLLISLMCSLTFALLFAGIMFLYSAPMQTCSRHSNRPGEQEQTLGQGGVDVLHRERGFWL